MVSSITCSSTDGLISAAPGAAAPAPAGAPLGTIGRTSSTASQSAKSIASVRRFMLQSAARDLMPREAVARCLRSPVPIRSYVDVLYAPEKASAHYGGLQVCKSVWMCPVCSAKISERRRADLTLGLKKWYEMAGERRVLLVTLTMSHKMNDNLSDVWRIGKKARKLLVSGRWANNFKAEHNIVGMVRSTELTYGVNGWHPHFHVLYFFDKEIAIVKFEDAIKRRWSACVASAGGKASYEHGCDVRYSDKEVSKYVAKFGKEPEWKDNNKELKDNKWSLSHEVTKGVTKTGRSGGLTPLQLLYDYSSGDSAAGRLWMQYAVNFKNERQLYWSNGFRKLLGLDEDKNDEELELEQTEVAIILAQLTHDKWRIVVGNDARAELLNVAASGDAYKVAQFLEELGI